VLTTAEVRQLVAGQAIPLVGYVAAIPNDHERTLVAEAGDPPPAALTAALDVCLKELSGELLAYELLRTFNPERDLEPHPTIKLRPRPGKVDHQHLARHVFTAVSPHLPPPGYVDIVFED